MDDEAMDFHQRVWEAYHQLAAAEPGRIKVVDGRADLDTVEAAVWKIVSAYV
jgi:thymidylate kinase